LIFVVKGEEAFVASLSATATVMLSSEEPWAMATTFHALARQRRERPSRNCGAAGHAEADDGDERDLRLCVDAVDELHLPLQREGILQRRHGVLWPRRRE